MLALLLILMIFAICITIGALLLRWLDNNKLEKTKFTLVTHTQQNNSQARLNAVSDTNNTPISIRSSQNSQDNQKPSPETAHHEQTYPDFFFGNRIHKYTFIIVPFVLLDFVVQPEASISRGWQVTDIIGYALLGLCFFWAYGGVFLVIARYRHGNIHAILKRTNILSIIWIVIFALLLLAVFLGRISYPTF